MDIIPFSCRHKQQHSALRDIFIGHPTFGVSLCSSLTSQLLFCDSCYLLPRSFAGEHGKPVHGGGEKSLCLLLLCTATGMTFDLNTGTKSFMSRAQREEQFQKNNQPRWYYNIQKFTVASATVIICSLSGTEKSNCSLCGLNKMYLRQLGAMF